MPEETSEPAASVAVSETVETNRHVNVAEITAKRTSGGTEIKVKSAVLEEYFKNQHAEVCRQAGYDDPGRRHTSSTVVPNLKAYRVASARLFVHDWEVRLDQWDSTIFEPPNSGSRALNLSILRAVGLGEGVTRLYSGLSSREGIRLWVDAVKGVIKALYVDYLKPVEFRLTITSEERN